MAETSDEDLLRQFSRGESQALGTLAARHESALLGLASGLLGGRTDLARDAVQDAWLRVIKYGRSFDQRSSVRTWLYRIVINRCRDLREGLAKANGTAHAAPKAKTNGAGAEPAPVADEELQRAVEHLSPNARLVVLLCYHRALSHEQAAEVLDIPVGTLKSRLHSALESLRGELTKGATG